MVPEYCYEEKEMFDANVEWVQKSGDASLIEKSINIFKNTGIKKKHSILPSKEAIFQPRTFDESNALYRKESVRYAIKIVDRMLEKTGIKPEEIDFLVSTSCTGLMSPAINAHLINKFRMRNDIIQIPVAQIGCSGGTGGIIYIDRLLKSKPKSKALMLNLEFNSNTLQHHNYNLDNVIGTAIFADGIACSLFENNSLQDQAISSEEQLFMQQAEKRQFLKIVDTFSHHFYDSQEILRYELGSTGFTLKMSKELPGFVAKNFSKTANNFLAKHNLSLKDMNHILLHPGGIRILESVQKLISEFGKNLTSSIRVMESYGNMSSATIMFILHDAIKTGLKKDEKILMTSFGPGFVANFILFVVA